MSNASTPETDAQVDAAFDRHKRGEITGAIAVYREVLRRHPGHARALHYLGLAAQQGRRPQEAVQLLEQSIASDPTDPRAFNHLGQVFVGLNDKRRAAAMFEKALEVDPNHVDSLINLANVSTTRDLEGAISLYRRALALRPDSVVALYNLAQALNEHRAFEEAVELFRRAIALNPRHLQARHSLAILLEQQGDFAQAIEQYLTVQQLDPRHASSLANLLGIRDYHPDGAMAQRAEAMLTALDLQDEDRLKLHRGLGKHNERLGDFENAFRHFRDAKSVFRRMRPTGDVAVATESMRSLRHVFTQAYFAQRRNGFSDDERPVFIVGLPRSGTTLTEQILASHAQVFGAGELQAIPNSVRLLRPDYPQSMLSLPADEIAELADDYLAEIGRLAGPVAARVTDKMPVNAVHLGLIATLFPNARIIHCRRDPRDVAVSCLAELFELEHDYTTRFDDFGRYFLEHERLMAHWRAVLPIPIHDLVYENLVADPEPASRALVAFCGLDWDPACLEFTKAERTVQTPSRWQVRQPIYSSSVGRWRRYEAHLGPLIELLDAAGYQYGVDAPRIEPDEDPADPPRANSEPAARPPEPSGADAPAPQALRRPLFIVAAPRSGSSLLFETLTHSARLSSVGGEAHWLVENLAELRPGAPGVGSNRLTADHATRAARSQIVDQLLERLVDERGVPLGSDSDRTFLEKTPKNALRIPFFDRIFPDARFIFLWRDPRENISSIIEAWRSERFITYRGLPGFSGPWSLLLPPGFERWSDRPLEGVAAFQWDAANRIILDDLSALDPRRWTSLRYDQLLADPRGAVDRLMAFAGLPMDSGLTELLKGPLPHSRHTQTAPQADKWRRNQAEVDLALPRVEATWRRLLALG